MCQRFFCCSHSCCSFGCIGCFIGFVLRSFFSFFRLSLVFAAICDFNCCGAIGSAGVRNDKGAANHQIVHVVTCKGIAVGVVDGAHHFLDGYVVGWARGVGNREQGFVRFDRAVFAAHRDAARFDFGGKVGIAAFAAVATLSHGGRCLLRFGRNVMSAPALGIGTGSTRGVLFACGDLFFGLLFFAFFFVFFRVSQRRFGFGSFFAFCQGSTRFGFTYGQELTFRLFQFIFFAFFLAFAVIVRQRRFFNDRHGFGSTGVERVRVKKRRVFAGNGAAVAVNGNEEIDERLADGGAAGDADDVAFARRHQAKA